MPEPLIREKNADSTFDWAAGDISTLCQARDWRSLLQGVEVVVNASGALQDGPRDNVRAVQDLAIQALVSAAESAGIKRLVQISAPGTERDASTRFMRSKARADECLRHSSLDWVILKPGLVIGHNAYGGSALLRALAAFPLVQPVLFADAKVQTIGLSEVVEMVGEAVEGRIDPQLEYDLVERESHSLGEVLAGMWSWFGLAAAKQLPVPRPVGMLAAGIGDMLGYLGWRPPLRTTALTVMAEGVTGDPAPLREAMGKEFSALHETLQNMPAGVQERWFARVYLALPVMIAVLSIFWIMSGVIGLFRVLQAAAILPEWLTHSPAGNVLVVGGALVDIALGLAVLWRPWAKRACLCMAAMSALYLVLETIFAPCLWVDPMGPYVKVLPGLVLAWVTSLLLDER